MYNRVFKVSDRFDVVVMGMGNRHVGHVLRSIAAFRKRQKGTTEIAHVKSRHRLAARVRQDHPAPRLDQINDK